MYVTFHIDISCVIERVDFFKLQLQSFLRDILRAIPFKHTSPPGRHSEIGGTTHRGNFLLCVTLNRSDFESDVTTNRSELFFQKFCY